MKYQKAYILATANLKEMDIDLCPKDVQFASATDVRGSIPVIPKLEDQKDLTKLVAILLSTGINRNDDVFLPKEILPVRNTGAHKPVNLEHDPKQIVGHILRTFATEKGGKRIPDGRKPEGRNFDITAEAVLYKFLFPGLVSEVKDRADSNELFVSVEVWFTAFDFLVGSQPVKRTAETASIIEPHLKVNGGSGDFEGKRVGRILRNIIVGGLGVVKDPANPESIIKSVSSFDSEVVQEIENEIIAKNIICDLYSSDEDSETTEPIESIDVITNLQEVNMNPELIEEMAAIAAATQAQTEESKNEAIEIEINEENPELQAIASRLAALEKDNQELKAQNVESEFKAEAGRREKMLRDAGFDDPQVEKQITRCFNMSKSDFDNYVGCLLEAVNSLLRTKASVATETEATQVETPETEVPKAETSETSVEENKVSEEVVDVQDNVVETPADQTEVIDSVDDTTEIEENIEVDIEAIDPEINTEGEQSEPNSLTDQMGDIVQRFLKHRSPKWNKLAIND